eukprot:Partr_v1_DN26102_c0_g1_i1_m10674 putative Signal-recognition-particle assembly has a crucial role in targeting secretory proteins to the rough endoplasmic reticulum membrane (By similarity)
MNDWLETQTATQQENGIPADDYGRYRKFCHKRVHQLSRLFPTSATPSKDLNQPSRVVDPATGAVRPNAHSYILMVLFEAEKAWAFAMELKTGQGDRGHSLRRLKRACQYSRIACSLSVLIPPTSGSGLAMSQVEVFAYSAQLEGLLLFERAVDGLWKRALERFSVARQLYRQLGSPASRARLELLEPFIRYCLYNLGSASAEVDDLVGCARDDHERALLSTAAPVSVAATPSFGAATVEFRSRLIPLANPQLAALLGRVSADKGGGVLLLLVEAEALALSDIASASHQSGEDELTALKCIHASISLRRLRVALDESINGSPVSDDQLDCARLYESCGNLVADMRQLFGYKDDPVFVSSCQSLGSYFRSLKCLALATQHSRLDGHAGEAVELADRALTALSDVSLNSIDPDLASVFKCLSLDVNSASAKSKLLELKSGLLRTASGTNIKLPKTSQKVFPPHLAVKEIPMRLLPCKPIFYDLAGEFMLHDSLPASFGGGVTQSVTVQESTNSSSGSTGVLGGLLSGLWGRK